MRIRIQTGVLSALLMATACGDTSSPRITELPLTSVDAKPVPTTIASANGITTISGGYVRGSSSLGRCTWLIRSSGGSEIEGESSSCSVRSGTAVALDLTLPGPVFGPGTHTFRFGP